VNPNRWATLVGLVVVALAAAALSFASLRSLSIVCGTPVQLAWLTPVSIDVCAVVATWQWLAAESTDRSRRTARVLALAALVLSIAGNAADHGLAAYRIVPPWWAVVAVAAVPPAVLGAVAHLAALVFTRRSDRTAVGPDAAPVGEDADRSDQRSGVVGERSDEELLAELRAMAEASSETPSVTAVRTGLRIGTGRARRLLAQLNT
jgi:hypothetical protein